MTMANPFDTTLPPDAFGDTRTSFTDTARGAFSDTARGAFADTSRTPFVDTSRTPFVDTSGASFRDTARTPFQETARTPFVETARTPLPDTAREPLEEPRAASWHGVSDADRPSPPPLDDRIPLEPIARAIATSPDRLVFFFSGFDPKGGSFYHRLFRGGIAQRNKTHDDTLAVGKRYRIGSWASTWTVLWRGSPAQRKGGGRTTRTRVHFMRWDDIIRSQWKRRPAQLARDYWNVYARGLFSGVFSRIWRKSRAAYWLAMFPLGVMFASALAGLVVVGGALLFTGAAPGWAAALAGLAAGLGGWRLLAHWIDCEWLLRLYAFARQQALGLLPSLEAREDEMAEHLLEVVEARLRQPCAPPLREVLLIGYSSGSTMAASVLARALPRLTELINDRGATAGTTLGLLTLGHCIPIAADWDGAHRTRRELEELAACRKLTWHDYSAPADWAAFARTPPWPEPAELQGHQASPRFHKQLSALQYASLRRNRREMHLQYLRPPAHPVDAGAYDYFLLAAGPTTLAERHAALKSGTDSGA
jgi:hypothetical protein